MSREPLDDETREQLVAYLDGELADGECAAIESRLASDDALRAEVQGLDRAWNALDDLPRATVGDAFAKSTIEMVAVEAERDVATLTAALPVRRRRRHYALAGACAGALLLGFALVRTAATRPDRMLVANLPVIYQVDALQNAGDVSFLRQLPKVAPNLLAAAEGADGEEAAQAWEAIVVGDPPSRREWVASLSENDKARLHDSARRYARDLTPARRQAVDHLFAEISTANDREQLMQTTLAYDEWLAKQTASEQAQLRKLSADDRLQELGKRDRRIAAQSSRFLPEADTVALLAAVVGLKETPEFQRLGREIQQRMEQVMKTWQRGNNRPDRSSRIGQMRRIHPAFSVVLLAEVAGDRSRGMERLFRDDWKRIRKQAREDWEVVEQKLTAALSPEAQQRLEKLPDADRRREQLARWVEHAARSAFESIDLETYFASDDLTDAERHELLTLPTEQMERQLRRMYVERQLGGSDRFQMGTGPMGPGMRGPRDRDDRDGRGDRGGRDDRGGRGDRDRRGS